MIDSLPRRPLRTDEVDALDESDRVVNSYVVAEYGVSGTAWVLALIVVLDVPSEPTGEQHVALSYRDRWHQVGRAPTFEEAASAFESESEDLMQHVA